MSTKDRKKIKLWDIMETLKWFAFKNSCYVENGIPLVRASNFTDNSIDDNWIIFIDNNSDFDEKYKLISWDILVQTVGSWPSAPASVVWKVVRVPKKLEWALLNQNIVKIIPRNWLFLNYLYYNLKSFFFKNYIISWAQWAASQASITLEHIKHYKLFLPPLPTQQAIASILSKYDDLIENNNQRIKILEQEAELIYKERFVKFKFPWRENVKMVDSWTDFWLIPEEWEVKSIWEKFITILWGTPSRVKSEYRGWSIPWINSWKINEMRIINESEFISNLWLQKSSAKLMPPRTTVLAITGSTLWQVSLLEIEACWNQSVIWIYDQNKLYNNFIFLKIKEIIWKIISNAWWWAQQHINKDIVNETRILLSSKNILEKFNIITNKYFNGIKNLLTQNQNLRQTRDMLLPKLISGEIEI